MAVLRFPNRVLTAVSKKEGLHLWEVMQGREEPDNAKEAEWLDSCQGIYLNRHDPDCPQDWLDSYAHVFPGMDGTPIARKTGW
jgi:hypothetical protein